MDMMTPNPKRKDGAGMKGFGQEASAAGGSASQHFSGAVLHMSLRSLLHKLCAGCGSYPLTARRFWDNTAKSA
jgi:hypothetical protein